MAWDAIGELATLQERFRRPSIGRNWEILNAKWMTLRPPKIAECGLWLPSPSKPGMRIRGRVFLDEGRGIFDDRRRGEAVIVNEVAALYTTTTEAAVDEFRELSSLGGDIIARIPELVAGEVRHLPGDESWNRFEAAMRLVNELHSFVDNGESGQNPSNEQWWLAWLFREVVSEISVFEWGDGLGYDVEIKGVYRASEAACKRLSSLFPIQSEPKPAAVGLETQTNRDQLQETPKQDEGKQGQSVDGIIQRLAVLFGDSGGAMLAVIHDAKLSVDQKLRALERIDQPRICGMNSEQLADILGVSAQAVRKSDWWKERKPQSDE